MPKPSKIKLRPTPKRSERQSVPSAPPPELSRSRLRSTQSLVQVKKQKLTKKFIIIIKKKTVHSKITHEKNKKTSKVSQHNTRRLNFTVFNVFAVARRGEKKTNKHGSARPFTIPISQE